MLPLINKIDFSNYLQPEKCSISGDQLNNQQLAEITQLVNAFEKQNNIYKKDRNNQSLENQQLENSIQKYQNIIQLLLLNVEVFSENNQSQIDFSSFTSKQIQNIEKLANKISSLNQQFGEVYYDNQFPKFNQQPNSYKLLKLFLGDQITFKQLFVDYPILETIDLIKLKSQTYFIKTNFSQSQQLILEDIKEMGYLIKQPKPLSGQVFLSSSLQTHTDLYIDLSQNEIGDEFASSLCSALEKCNNISILQLELRSNKVGDSGASFLGFALENCSNLSNLTLDLSENQIGEDGALCLGSSLANCLSLSYLYLNLLDNQLGDIGAQNLGSGLANCTNLSNLTLNLA
ncbi:hypothetical protein ABPG72_020915, partial [Tetrahymena utriculariae]